MQIFKGENLIVNISQLSAEVNLSKVTLEKIFDSVVVKLIHQIMNLYLKIECLKPFSNLIQKRRTFLINHF